MFQLNKKSLINILKGQKRGPHPFIVQLLDVIHQGASGKDTKLYLVFEYLGNLARASGLRLIPPRKSHNSPHRTAAMIN